MDYRSIADRLASDIAAGKLKPGERLPPQRDFAYRQGIAVSTASRVYAELVRRGLVSGEIGRGTYVASRPTTASSLSEPNTAAVDLEFNFSLPHGHEAALSEAVARVMRASLAGGSLGPIGARASRKAREVAAHFIGAGGWSPRPADLLFTGNGRQGIASVFAALAPPGDKIGVEALTYPIVKGLAARLGITLVPLAVDEDGLRPDLLAEAARGGLRAVYLQPSLHNPLGSTMSEGRRRDIAAVLHDTGLIAIEDAVFTFLVDEPPIAAFAPERTILVDSLSKRVAPGMTLGIMAVPEALTDRVAAAVRNGGWTANGVPLAIGLDLMASGLAREIAIGKRADAAARQAIAAGALAGLDLRRDARAYHLWLALPDRWRGESYVAAAARLGIAIAPASAFTMAPGHAPNAVRIALAAPPLDTLAAARSELRRLAARDPGETEIE